MLWTWTDEEDRRESQVKQNPMGDRPPLDFITVSSLNSSSDDMPKTCVERAPPPLLIQASGSFNSNSSTGSVDRAPWDEEDFDEHIKEHRLVQESSDEGGLIDLWDTVIFALCPGFPRAHAKYA